MAGLFISHASSDKPFVLDLAVELLNHGFPVWLDTWELSVGDSLVGGVYKGIDQSSQVLLVVSQAAQVSGWVERETNAAIAKEIQLGRKFVIPLRLSTVSLPPQVADRLYVDFTGPFLEGFEKLERELRKLKSHEVAVPPEKAIIPLAFDKGVHLRTVALAKRLEVLKRAYPRGLTVTEDQFAVLVDPEYAALRAKLRNQVELGRSASFDLALKNALESQYDEVKRLEAAIPRGMAILLNQWQFDDAPFFDMEAAEWYTRILRGRIVSTLYGMQDPADGVLCAYGKEWDCAHFGNSDSAAKFYGLRMVVAGELYPTYGRAEKFETFTVWLPADGPMAKDLGWENGIMTPGEVRDVRKRDELPRYIVPQMLVKHVLRGGALLLDFDKVMIGIS